ncbi:T-kininogen 1-like [Pelobates fuscus]|uniref:T-kininogen 1-like n=1 Tax=Pelobates fuscus TaxID=191477 RepID=UPI002FE4303A
MRLLITLLLCSHIFIVSANKDSPVADCNDPIIFSAVDLALRSYNAQKNEGNQFVLYRIEDAQIKHENDRLINQFVSYGIREGSCGVKSGKVWQDCDFGTSDIGFSKCSAHVLVNKELGSTEVVSQNCSEPIVETSVKVVHQPCLGCFQSVDANNKELLPIVKAAVEKMNSNGNHPYLFDLDNIQSAVVQVVAGWNYKIAYGVRQTNCSKSSFTTVASEECKVDNDGQTGSCTADVFVTPNEVIQDILLNCKSITGFCLNCPNQIEPNDPFLLNLLNDVIDKYNSESNQTNLFKTLNVVYAEKKISDEIIYLVEFKLQETNCSKTDYRVLEEECHASPVPEIISCEATINATGKNIQSTNQCLKGQKQNTGRITLKGFSPLRMGRLPDGVLVRPARGADKFQKPSSHHKENKGHEHGKKDNKKNKDKRKKKQGHDKDDSSEESREDQRKKDHVIDKPFFPKKHVPDTTTQQTVRFSTTHSLSLDDSELVLPSLKETTDVPLFPLLPPLPDDQGKFPNIHEDISFDLPSVWETIDSPLFPLLPALPDDQGNFLNIHEDISLDLPEPEPEPVAKCPGKVWEPKRLLSTLKPTDKKSNSVPDPPLDLDDSLFSLLDF